MKMPNEHSSAYKESVLRQRIPASPAGSEFIVMSKQTKLGLEQVLGKVKHSDEARDLIQRLKPFMGGDPKCVSLHATYLILNLYSPLGSDEANISRITSNLEMAAADLEMTSQLIKSLL